MNHRSFADAPLCCGDRLSIGPIDLEVLSVGRAPVSVEPSLPGFPGISTEVDLQTKNQQKALQDDRRRLDELAVGLDNRQASLLLQEEHLNARRVDLEVQRQEWQTEEAEANKRLDAQWRQFSDRLAELENQQKTLIGEHRQWEAEQTAATAQLAAREEQLNTRLAELEAARKSLEQRQQHWQAEQAEAQQRFDAQRDELNTKQGELETQRKALDEERRQWELQDKTTTSETAVQAEQLAAQRVELETQRNALAEERRQWEAEQTAAAAQITAREEQLDARLAELETAQKSLEKQQEAWQIEQADARRQLETQREELDARQSELESQQNTLTEERRQWEAQRSESARQIEPNIEVESMQEASPVEPEFQTPTEEAPVDLADIFRRLGAKVDMEDEEPASSASEMRPQPPRDDASRSSATPAPAPAKDKEEEESIDDYMRRLMQRVGRTVTSAYTSPSVQPSKTSQETPSPVAKIEPPKPQGSETQSTASLAPRAVAPETHTDISALRELANLSAHNALGRHSRKMLIRTMHSKLVVTLVALIAGAALLWMWRSLSPTQMTFYAALLALLVTIYWGLEYALLTGRLIISRSGHIDIDWKSRSHDKKTTPPEEDEIAGTDADQSR